MAKQNIMLTIEEDVIKKVKENLKPVGGSISAVAENMLIDFNKTMSRNEGIQNSRHSGQKL